MARKPTRKSRMTAKRRAGRDYKAEYQRRKAAGKAAGKTTQQARGHKAREHVARAARERREHGGLTLAQVHAVERFAGRQARRADRPDAIAQYLLIAQEHGYGAIADIKARMAAIERMRKRDDHRRPGESKSDAAVRKAAAKMERIALMYELADDYGLDVEYFYYGDD